MYTNRYSRKYPGLVVIVLDQSFAMREEYKGVSCITCATKVINTIIGELCLRNCDGVDIGNRVFVQIFEHGVNEEVEESKSGWLSEYFESLPIRWEKEVKKYFYEINEYAEREILRPIWIEPHADGIGNLPRVLDDVAEVVKAWKTDWQEKNCLDLMPVPLVINFHSGESTGMSYDPNESISQTLVSIDKIKEIDFPDGKPLISNVVVNPKCDSKVFPNECPSSEIETCLYHASSILPCSMRRILRYPLNSELKEGGRLFASNLSVEEMTNFCKSLFDLFYM